MIFVLQLSVIKLSAYFVKLKWKVNNLKIGYFVKRSHVGSIRTKIWWQSPLKKFTIFGKHRLIRVILGYSLISDIIRVKMFGNVFEYVSTLIRGSADNFQTIMPRSVELSIISCSQAMTTTRLQANSIVLSSLCLRSSLIGRSRTKFTSGPDHPDLWSKISRGVTRLILHFCLN